MMSNQKTSKSLGAKIRKARQEARLSQKELGKVLKLSDKAISAYEVDRAEPGLKTLKKIGKVTHKPVAYFLDETDPDDLELQLKIKNIERELIEVKRMLKARN